MIETHVCRNGVRIVHEKMPHAMLVALGIWVGAGSGDEMESEAGSSLLNICFLKEHCREVRA